MIYPDNQEYLYIAWRDLVYRKEDQQIGADYYDLKLGPGCNLCKT